MSRMMMSRMMKKKKIQVNKNDLKAPHKENLNSGRCSF